jgi:chromosome segregation ATPase
MITGRQALLSIEEASNQLHKQELQLDQSLKSVTEEAARLRQERLETFRALAQHKFELLKNNRLINDLDAAERKVKAALAGLEQKWNTASGERNAALDDLQRVEVERNSCAEAVETAQAGLTKLQAEIAPSMANDREWLATKGNLERVEKLAGEAEKKAQQAESDRERKKVPYESDPLFMYLWRRKLGTSQYHAGFLTRFIDNKIAGLTDYRQARANYAMLNEIPERLREHANRKAQEIQAAQLALAAFEQDRLVMAGGGPLTSALAEGQARLAACEARVAELRQRLAALDQQHEALSGSEYKGIYAQAVDAMMQNDLSDDIQILMREAQRTPTGEDNALVQRIDRLNAMIAKADGEVAQARTDIRELARRRAEIERARIDFRQRGYDYPGTTFRNDSAFRDILGGILQGAVQGLVLGQVMQQGYQQPQGPSWGRGPSMGRASFPSPGSGGLSGGGGFRTGGMF